MMNEPDSGNSLLSSTYKIINVPNSGPLEVNCLSPNLVVLGDSFRLGEGSIESGDGTLNTSTKRSVDRSLEEDGGEF